MMTMMMMPKGTVKKPMMMVQTPELRGLRSTPTWATWTHQRTVLGSRTHFASAVIARLRCHPHPSLLLFVPPPHRSVRAS
jgi:hypothetical protein